MSKQIANADPDETELQPTADVCPVPECDEPVGEGHLSDRNGEAVLVCRECCPTCGTGHSVPLDERGARFRWEDIGL